ncbi:sodium/hydrogen exchanger 9B1 isoform X2 [Drosophila hydei]|uniref:Sodium/hydrogen exchanger 9B1 isoform X2 n=1 Tax=Drosophila hydei TaxID=7224 RepID=A0A6J1MCB4_DROHY|nr:sodium/hydrogen exchanger 9B1 isoform X2 [Drosophila hydei]
MDSESDVNDIVANSDGPELQSFRSNYGDETNKPKISRDHESNSTPVQMLRRASETVTQHILSDLEPETQHLLDGALAGLEDNAQKRPQAPPRSYMTKRNISGDCATVRRGKQPSKMIQCDKSAAGCPAQPSHTKLDIHNFSEDHNNGPSEPAGGRDGGESQPQNAATIILTPTSLNLTNPPPNATHNNSRPNAADTDTNGRGYSAHGEHYKGPKWWRHLVLHWGLVSEHVALLVIFLGLWTLALALLPNYAAPDTVIMRIILLFVGAHLAGILVTFIHLPDMLGMLFFGVLYTNVGFANFEGYERFELFLRELALINIMLLAGLGLDAGAFRRLWLMILRLTLLPTIFEVAVIAVLAHFTLSMPWLWGTALGLVITAVSPNVVVTVMLKLKEDRLGLNSGIHTLIYAMTTCNDVVAIFMFGVVISMIFSTGSLTQKLLQGPIGIGIGLVFGYLYGMLLHYLPSRNAVYANGLRFALTMLGGTIAVMGSRIIGYTSAGALGCVMLACIGGIGWKREALKMTPQQLQAYEIASVPKRLDLLWKFLKPVSFALIGKEINFAVLEGRVIGYGALLVVLGSLFRLAFAYLSTYGGNLSSRERAYITISGFPKATVQAALGPVALDLARSFQGTIDMSLPNNVLIISVLAIIFTAPLGAILMLRLAPFWLKHGDPVDTAETPVTAIEPSPLNNLNARNSAKL